MVAFLLKVLITTVGQYAINWLNNVINEKMTPKEAFQNTPIIIGVQGTIPYKENKPPTNNYNGSSGSGISESDINRLSRGEITYSSSFGYTLDPLYQKAILGGGPGSNFFSTDLAAMDFGIRYNDNSIELHREIGTLFYSYEENGIRYYSYILPIIGYEHTVSLPRFQPWGTQYEGIGHTHGFGYGYELFSDLDKSTFSINYMCSPMGVLYKYDARDKSTTVITRDLPNMNNFLNYPCYEPMQYELNFWRRLFRIYSKL